MVSGETTSTTIAVWNTDTAEHTYTLTYDYLPADFHGYFMQNNTVTDTVTIPASESAVLAFLVDVPADTTTKELHISLNAVKEDGTANTFPVTYTLNNEYGVVISNNVTLIKARITSYNVCYTKLLRPIGSFAAELWTKRFPCREYTLPVI